MSLGYSTGTNDGILNALKTALNYGVIRIYSGTRPASANDAESGTMLVEITSGGQTFTPGQQANGLEWEVSGGVLQKNAGQIWTGTVQNNGTASWFRVYANDRTTGQMDTASRIDGDIGISTGDMILATRSLTAGGSQTIDKFQISIKA